MNEKLKNFVISMAEHTAELHCGNMEENFLYNNCFDPKPCTKQELIESYQAFVLAEDAPWWNCFEMVSDEIPDMLEDNEDLETITQESKALIAETYDFIVIEKLKKIFITE